MKLERSSTQFVNVSLPPAGICLLVSRAPLPTGRASARIHRTTSPKGGPRKLFTSTRSPPVGTPGSPSSLLLLTCLGPGGHLCTRASFSRRGGFLSPALVVTAPCLPVTGRGEAGSRVLSPDTSRPLSVWPPTVPPGPGVQAARRGSCTAASPDPTDLGPARTSGASLRADAPAPRGERGRCPRTAPTKSGFSVSLSVPAEVQPRVGGLSRSLGAGTDVRSRGHTHT